jgi:hypothetical protein
MFDEANQPGLTDRIEGNGHRLPVTVIFRYR